MMKKLIFYLVPLVFLGVLVFQLSQPDEDYIKSVERIRNERIQFLKNAEESPFKTSGQDFFAPEYFPVDEKYRVNATLTRLHSKERRSIAASDGTTSYYTSFATAHFKLMGQPCSLLILKPWGFGQMDTYFTGFVDETSAESTYGGGRYLDLDIGKSDKVVIDFNLAYNPYCAYVADYSCPFPPKENMLPIAIMAGEKDTKTQ